MKNLLWMLDTPTNTEVSDLTKNATSLWNDTILPIVNIVIWILVGILGVVFIAKAIMTAMAVMKAADEPQVRQEKIQGFKYLAIALGIAIVVLTLANVLLTYLGNSTTTIDKANTGNSFLF